MRRFKNRREAGRNLANVLHNHADDVDVIVLALPRGGVPVGYEVAVQLKAPLEVFLVRKLGVPGHEEYAMGAIASGGIWFVNEDVVSKLGISRKEIQRIVEREQRELEHRMESYGREFSANDIRDRTVILVDDGLATGSTMRVAVKAVTQQHPKRIVVAVPVAPPSTLEELQREVDEVVCVHSPWDFNAVGQWYEDFSQTSDEEVKELLNRARAQMEPVPIAPWPALF